MKTNELKKIILKLFKDKELYGYEVNKRLASKGVEIELSRLYRVLTEMLKEGIFESRWEKSSSGPRKRIYKIGKRGRDELDRILLDAIETVHEFYSSYLLSLLPKINVFNDILKLLADDLKGHENIACIIPKYSSMHEMMIVNLQRKIPNGKFFLVKPNTVQVDLKIDNLFISSGTYEDIPMKDDYVNLFVLIDLPKKDLLEASVLEWHRLLNKSGKLAILTPTILIQKQEDPLTIGDYVEKHEHETIEKGEHIDWELLRSQLSIQFSDVNKTDIVHMTIIKASGPR